jgi:hypothetical protein
VGGGAFVTMSAAVAAVSDVAMSSVEKPATLSEVHFMAAIHLLRDILAAFRSYAKAEDDVCIAFLRNVATGSQ